ncbi:hypothetical protein KAW48_07170 [candidate division WOR-3 bacterium]|nr:hypothetical protein [candidate division WOR-3 bacterium]
MRKLSFLFSIIFTFALFSGTIEEEAHRFELIGEPIDSTVIIDYLARYTIPFSLETIY